MSTTCDLAVIRVFADLKTSNTLFWWVRNTQHTDYKKRFKYMSTYSTNPKPNLTVYSES